MRFCFCSISPELEGGTWTLKQEKPSLAIVISSGGFVFYRHMIKRRCFMIKRQGDVLALKVKGIPEGAVKKDNLVLAEGEATGHLHELNTGELYEKNGTLYFRVPEDKVASLIHPEHNTITFEPGVYKVIHQREYEPSDWKQPWRRVSD
jgi:hypothetical protein